MSSGSKLYTKLALGEAWRVVSMIDRNPHSKTRGSMSRTHWAWKFEDFPFPRLQEGVCALAFFHNLNDPDNPLHDSDDVKQWIIWGFDYWMALQHKSGAFDEAYPNEQCLAATAFTCFYLGWAFREAEGFLPNETRSQVRAALCRAADWLCHNDEYHGILSNHLASAVAALEVVGRLTGERRYQDRAEVFLDRIFENQSAEGWMLEYEGADVGYGTHGLFYLSVYWHLTGSQQVLEALKRFSGFLQYCVHPDGTIGGEYTSRNTEFYYPAGFEILAANCEISAGIARVQRGALAEKRGAGIWAMDTFNFFPLLNNLLFAERFCTEAAQARDIPFQQAPFKTYFAEAGLWFVNTTDIYGVVGVAKGGSISVFDKQARVLRARFSGYLTRYKNKNFTSQDYTLLPQVRWSDDGDTVSFSVPWRLSEQITLNTWTFMVFRLFTVTFGRSLWVSRWLKKILVALLIRRKKKPSIHHQRRIHFTGSGFQTQDDIEFPHGIDFLSAASQFTSVHMGSSMYADIRSVNGSTAIQNLDFPGGSLRIRGAIGCGGQCFDVEAIS